MVIREMANVEPGEHHLQMASNINRKPSLLTGTVMSTPCHLFEGDTSVLNTKTANFDGDFLLIEK